MKIFLFLEIVVKLNFCNCKSIPFLLHLSPQKQQSTVRGADEV